MVHFTSARLNYLTGWSLLMHTYAVYICRIYIILDGWPSHIDYIGRRKLCASSNIAYWVQYNLLWTVNHPILHILFTIKINLCENISILSANGEILILFSFSTFFFCLKLSNISYIGQLSANCTIHLLANEKRIYWIIMWAQSAFVIGQLVYSG